MNFKRLVKEGGITDDEKVIRKERGEPGKCNMKLKGRKSFKKETWCGDKIVHCLRVQTYNKVLRNL